MKKMIVLVGNYGSGKTEIAVNLAVNGAGQGLRTLVIDLDKVNDYFRMSDRVALLQEKKIRVRNLEVSQLSSHNSSCAVISFRARNKVELYKLTEELYGLQGVVAIEEL